MLFTPVHGVSVAFVSQGPAQHLVSATAGALDAGAGVAIAICSVDWHLRDANALFLDLTGLHGEALARTTLADVIAEENDPVAVQAFSGRRAQWEGSRGRVSLPWPRHQALLVRYGYRAPR